MKKILLVVLLLSTSLFAACRVRNLPPDASDVIILRNGKMQKARAFELLDTLYVEIAPLLKAKTAHVITLRAADGATIISSARVMTDAKGAIPPVAMWYDVGLVTNGEAAGELNPDKLEITAFEVNVRGGGTNLTLPFFVFLTKGVVDGSVRGGLPPAPVVWAAAKDGKLRGVFVEDDDTRLTASTDDEVYVGGRGFDSAKGSVDVYVTLDRNWQDRDAIAGHAVVGPVSVPVLPDGTLDPKRLVWDIDLAGLQENAAYDLVADTDKDGRYDAPRDDAKPLGEWDAPGPDAADNLGLPGFIVVRNPGFPLGQTRPTLPAELDEDGDGLTDSRETQLGTDRTKPDTDGDGLTDSLELNLGTDPLKVDTDGDGLDDGLEQSVGTLPTKKDTDNDGLYDGVEDANASGTIDEGETDPLKADTDGGGDGDGAEIDAGTDPRDASDDSREDPDGDGLSNADEVLAGANSEVADTDGDGLNDFEEVRQYGTDPLTADTDGDRLTDGEEVATYKTNPNVADTDKGGTEDGDEVLISITNPLQHSDDGDGDPDGDGVLTRVEGYYGTNPFAADTDGDGISDYVELRSAFLPGFPSPVSSPPAHIYYQDPTALSAVKPDTDGDGISDGLEDLNRDGLWQVGVETDPTSVHSDGDGWSDHQEVFTYYTSPATEDTDGDLDPDDTDPSPRISDTLDDDDDGLSNQDEQSKRTLPNDADTDNDGLSDGAEVNTHGTSPLTADSDGDGYADGDEVVRATDPLVADTDDDGVTDGNEVVATGTDPLVTDSDGDGLADGDEDVDQDGVLDEGESDPVDPDTDDGGSLDGQEVVEGTDPSLRAGQDDSFSTHANVHIASTGHLSETSGQWGYADIFNSNGNDTLSNNTIAAGIKAVWNPWMMPATLAADPDYVVKNAENNGTLPEGFGDFSNLTVDVYVIALPVDESGKALADFETYNGLELVDVSGNVERLPVQWGTHSGLGQQNIWLPPYPKGDYVVVVDIDGDGKYTKGVDLIDARRNNKDPKTPAAGFSVVGK